MEEDKLPHYIDYGTGGTIGSLLSATCLNVKNIFFFCYHEKTVRAAVNDSNYSTDRVLAETETVS